jgi:hypothetical protein
MSGEVVRVRTPQRAFVLHYVLAVCHFTIGTLSVTVTGDDLGMGVWPYVLWGLLSLAMAALTAACMLQPPGVDLRDDVAEIVRLRRRTVPWRDVQAVAFDRRGMLKLHLADGTGVRCGYPSHQTPFVGWSRVDADFHRVGRWWLAHRGPEWQPIAPPPPPPRTPSAYPPYPPMRPVS